uniref:Uncharacterized protein n=1 Tax=Amphimedon queenslandica TaxID=400682 RepID=A0A1X7T1U2_AMPQE
MATHVYIMIIQNINFIKRNERVEMFLSLLMKASTCSNFDINSNTNSGSTSTLSYITLQYNLTTNDIDTYGCSPLVYCQAGSINSIKYLINNHNSDPNITGNDGMTCLHISCHNGHIDVTQYLIEVQHCDINKTDKVGHTLVHHAAWSGNFDLVQYLLQLIRMATLFYIMPLCLLTYHLLWN